MKIRTIGSTKPNYIISQDEILNFSGKAAGICYMKEDFDTLNNEDISKTKKRIISNIENGHHSVLGHVQINLLFEDAPKILAIILNNEKVYNTSERSARYTKMKLTGQEEILYNKYMQIFSNLISQKYQNFTNIQVKKLAQENARYFISVFTPNTTFEYSTNICQLNYLIYWANLYIQNEEENGFSKMLKKVLKEFVENVSAYCIENLNTKTKNRSFTCFASRKRSEEFGENYSTNYTGSFAQYAQAQRHRTLAYEFSIPDNFTCYIPKILENTKYKDEYIKDMESIKDIYPQGTNININERGTYENFILKCQERICGAAQLEIAQQTKDTLDKYYSLTQNEDIKQILKPYIGKSRCFFPNFTCKSPCVFGPIDSYTREI